MLNIDTVTPQDLRFNPPSFSKGEIASIIGRDYDLQGEWVPLEGERDQNFRLTTESGEKYVVKIAGPDEDPDVVDFQVQALLYLENGTPDFPVPRIIRTNKDQCLSSITDAKGITHAVRVVSYLNGIPYGEGQFPNAETLRKIGAFQANSVNALKGFEHKASTHFMPWNLSNGIAVSKDMWARSPNDAKVLAAPLLDRLRNDVLPQLNATPSQVIHNDAHPWNLLRPDEKSTDVVGLIDFGDMVYAPVINDLAVMASTFQSCDKEDLETIENLLLGFHEVHPLTDEQVSLLWDAIILRVLITILLSDAKLSMTTDHDPDVIEEREHGMSRLEIIRSLDHKTVVDRLRAICGF